MSTEENILVLQKQLNELHAKIQIEWIEKQLIECPNDGVEQLYQKWIEQDWTLQKRFILPSLSVDLDSKLLNGEKKIIHGDFLLQVNSLKFYRFEKNLQNFVSIILNLIFFLIFNFLISPQSDQRFDRYFKIITM